MLCKNCHTELTEDCEYCHHCGARVIRDRISLRFLFNEFVDKVLSIDNKLLKTFAHLFTKPEHVIGGYIEGTRKKYFNPISYFLVSLTLAGIYFFFFKEVAVESFEVMQKIDPDNPVTNKDLGKKIYSTIYDYPAIFTSINIPVYAFVSWLVFLNKRKYNFYEHVIIYLYGQSQVSIVSFLIVLPIYFFDRNLAADLFLYSGFTILIYSSYVLIRLFKLSFVQFLLKFLLLLAISIPAFILLGILINIIMLITMGPEEFFKMIAPQNN